MKKYFLILVTFILFFTCENVKADVLCKSATSLHTEICSQTDTNYFCSADGYTNGATITYGSLVSSDNLTTGDAFDCDVNGDGKYDAATERFYYVTDMDANTAVLVYYNNVSGGEASNSTAYAYDSSGSDNNGPTTAIEQLPKTTQWKNVNLTTDTRAITNQNGGTTVSSGNLPTAFKYTGYAARLLTYQEVNKGCYDETTAVTVTKGLNNKCKFLMENTKYSSASIKTLGTWLETPYDSYTTFAMNVFSDYRRIGNDFVSVSSKYGVRPAIEVSKNRMEISKVSNDNQTTENNNTTNSTNTTEIVKVEDTGINKLKVGISIGLAILVMGIMVIVQSTMKVKEIEENQ